MTMRNMRMLRNLLCLLWALNVSLAAADYSTTFYTVSRGGPGSGLDNPAGYGYRDIPHETGSGVRFDFVIPVQSLDVWIYAGLESFQPANYLRVHFGDDQGQWGTEYYSGAVSKTNRWLFTKSAPVGREITWIRSESRNFVPEAYVNTKVRLLAFCDIDSDGDGMRNLDEIQTGTDPWDADSVFALGFEPSGLGDGTYNITWPGLSGKYYALQKADSTLSTYQDIASQIAGQTSINTCVVSVSGAEDLYAYRVVQTTDDIKSLNAVGLSSSTLDSGKTYLMCVNFESMTSDSTVASMLDAAACGLPSGTKLYFWDPDAQLYSGSETLATFPVTAWVPGTNVLDPGKSFWMNVPASTPSESYDVCFFGQVPSEDKEHGLKAGSNFGAFSFPVATIITGLNLNGKLESGAKIYYYDSDTGWGTETWATFPVLGWYPGTHVFQPAEGMVINTSTQTNWYQPKPYSWP